MNLGLDGEGHSEGVILAFGIVYPLRFLNLKYLIAMLSNTTLKVSTAWISFPCNKLSAIYDYNRDGRDKFFFSGEYPGSYRLYYAGGIYIVNINGDDIDSSTVSIDTLHIRVWA